MAAADSTAATGYLVMARRIDSQVMIAWNVQLHGDEQATSEVLVKGEIALNHVISSMSGIPPDTTLKRKRAKIDADALAEEQQHAVHGGQPFQLAVGCSDGFVLTYQLTRRKQQESTKSRGFSLMSMRPAEQSYQWEWTETSAVVAHTNPISCIDCGHVALLAAAACSDNSTDVVILEAESSGKFIPGQILHTDSPIPGCAFFDLANGNQLLAVSGGIIKENHTDRKREFFGGASAALSSGVSGLSFDSSGATTSGMAATYFARTDTTRFYGDSAPWEEVPLPLEGYHFDDCVSVS